MPRFPRFAGRTSLITGSVFEKFRAKLEEQGDNLVALHLGDAYAPPPYDLPIDPRFRERTPGFHRYCDTFGVYPLREALAEKLRTENGLQADPGNVMMTSGSCNALNISMQSLVDPGEDVLLLAPYWPFFRGMVRMAGGNVVEVPLYMRLFEDPGMDIGQHLERYRTAKTVALYINTPNNPSGKVLGRDHLQQIAEFVERHDLWLISDEAYDGMTYDGHVHLSVGAFPGMFERTLSMFTFSKVYMFSGLRLGYVVAPEVVLKHLNKVMVHQLYSPSTVSQYMMVEPVKTRSRWSAEFVDYSRKLRDLFLDNLEIAPRIPVPEGAYYLFFSIRDLLGDRSYGEVIDACLDRGVSVAPGEDFGSDFSDYIRLCFAAEPAERLELSIERLNEIFPG